MIRLLSLVLLVGCIDPIKEPVPEADAAPVDVGSKFKPDAGENRTVRLGGDGAADTEVSVTPTDSEEQPFDAGPTDLTVPDSEELPFDATLSGDALPGDGTTTDDVAPPDDVSTTCGNGACSNGEDCTTCAADCGKCPANCGDGTCDASETCVVCDLDCGKCPPPVCAVLSSAGCSDGKQCFPDGKANLCYAAGKGKHGEPCKVFNDCQVGALCVAGLCRQLCDWTGKDAGALCKPGVPCDKLVFEGAGEVGQSLGACKPSDPCNPLNDEGCGDKQTCVPSGWLKACTTAGTATLGAPCTGGCQKGWLCIENKCRARCQTLGELPKCPAGVCTPVLGPDDKAVPEFVGYCIN